MTAFKLPKTILNERENAWEDLFEKYSNIQNDDEFEIKDLNSVSENNDNNDNKNNEEKIFISKLRTPMRKHPALVQYWVETGNSPYQLIDENRSETGSSLNEDDDMECRTSVESQHSNVENEGANSASLFSSVDTAAYILSNTNVTKKSDAIAIIEGAKKSTTSPDPTVNIITNKKLSMNSSENRIVEGKISDTCEKTNKLNNKKFDMNEEAELIQKKLILPDGSISNDRHSLLLVQTFIKKRLSQKNFNNTPISRNTHNNSVKIIDILPTLANLDKILNTNKKLDKQGDVTLGDENSLFDDVSKISNQTKLSRKKLYTDRDSPVDILLSTVRNGRKSSMKKNLHPALLPTPIIKKRLSFKRRTNSFQRRRKKRLTSIFEPLEEPINDESDETNTGIAMDSGNETTSKNEASTELRKRLRSWRKKLNTSSAKKPSQNSKQNKQKPIDTMSDSDITDDNDELSVNEKQKCLQSKKMTDLIAQCSMKILKIQLERCVVTKSMPNTTLFDNQSVKSLDSLSDTSEHDIHNIDDESQDSESSTISIYKCVGNQEKNVIPKSQNKLLQTNIEESQTYENQDINEISINNASVTTDKHKIINNDDKLTTTICSESLSESDENSSVKLLSKPQSQSKAHLTKNIITFSSDEEDEFVKIIRENSKQNKEKHNAEEPKNHKSINITTDKEDLIHDLTSNLSNEELKISSPLPNPISLVIVESDDNGESTDLQQHISKNMKKSVKKHTEKSKDSSLIEKIRSIVQTSNIVDKIDNKPARNSVARVLQYESSSDSTENHERINISSKRFKVDSIKSRLEMDDSIEELERESKKSLDSNSNSNDTIMMINKKVSPKKIRKRKIRVHDRSVKNSKESLQSVKKLNITSKNIRELLDESKLSPKLATLCSTTHNDKINKQEKSIHRDKTSVSVSKSENIKNRTQNPTISKRKNNPTQSIKIRDVRLSDFSSDDDDDDNKLIIDNKQNGKVFTIDKKNNERKSFFSNKTSCIFPSIINDSSDDESLIFEPLDYQSINRKKNSNAKTMIFQTRFDNSDSND
ncbi:hypothetical protein PV327_007685 [Microctonus hyperodae]|uniref:Uncharacterized protein n=1 Tax=Microctonus hyperodae TaxID=165561 RepID=A0AA39FZQ4_MICHY|nr:hypothetical protein PV327_007685 [Microctonus hyperodae]